MSLRKRIQILLAFLVGIPFLVLLFESYQTGRQTLVAEMKLQARQIADLETAKMDLTFDPARLIVEGLVRAVETAPQLDAARTPSPGSCAAHSMKILIFTASVLPLNRSSQVSGALCRMSSARVAARWKCPLWNPTRTTSPRIGMRSR